MGFLKRAVKTVIQPQKQIIKTGGSLIKGDFKGAAKNATGAVTSASPVHQLNAVSGGRLQNASKYVPIVGSPASKMMESQSKIASGNFSGSDLRQYARETAKLGAIAAGGYFAAPVLGVSGTVTAVGAGQALMKGDPTKALQAGLSAFSGSELGEGLGIDLSKFSEIGDFARQAKNAFGPTRSPAESFEPEKISARPPVEPGQSSDASKLLIPALVIGAGYLIYRRMKK